MARAQASIGRSSNVRQSGLNRHTRRWLGKMMQQLERSVAPSATQCQANRYRKHFLWQGHLWLLVYHALRGGTSLRESFELFAGHPGLLARSGLLGADGEIDVSFSQFANSNTTRPADFVTGAVADLMVTVRQRKGEKAHGLPPNAHIFDSTFLRLSLKLASWAKCKYHQGGVQMQVQYDPALDLPEEIVITDAHANDYNRFDEAVLQNPERLAALQGHTLIFDLGYYSHARFAKLRATQVHVISRLRPQAKFQVEAELPYPQHLPQWPTERITILSQQRITLGSANNRTGAVLTNMRRICARVEPLPKAAKQGATPVCYDLITDRWDLDVEEVVWAYLLRWQIELFFRWLKSHVRINHWLGYSENAVRLTIYLTLIAHLLCVLAADAMGRTKRTASLLRRLAELFPRCVAYARREPVAVQLSLPGWGIASEFT